MSIASRARRAPLTIVVTATLALVPISLATTSAMAMPQHRNATRHLTWTYVQSQPSIGQPFCDAPSNCILPFSIGGGPPSTGDVSGTTVQAGSATVLPDGSIYANSIIKFTGTIRGCGAGTVAMRSTGLNRAGATSGEVVIVDGSGTGQLTGLTGRGNVVNGTADPSGNNQGTGTVNMRVRCEQP